MQARAKSDAAPKLASDCQPGTYIDERYRVEGELGRGGMGAVYRVFDEGKARVVALKLLRARDPKLIALFEREYLTLAKLSHPRVISAYDFGRTAHDDRYYTMELLAGSDLLANTPLPWLIACAHVRDICTSLALLHAQHLVHRDVNPRNVRLDTSGHAKLLDFGALAQFGTPSEVVGTPSCIAPEALRGDALDGRADLFSLGVVSYLIVTGHLPFQIARFADAEHAWLTTPLAPSQLVAAVPRALDELILGLLSIDPLGRPTSAPDVIDRLDAIAMTDDEPLSMIAQSHIASSQLVGRDAERHKLEQLLERVGTKQGAVVCVEGEAGVGKSRLLEELRVQSQLRGLACVHFTARPQAQRVDVLRALFVGLSEAAPKLVRTSPVWRAHRFTELEFELRDGIRALDTTKTSDPTRLTRVEASVVDLALDVARTKPLLFTIDDVHLLEPAQMGALALLARAAPDCAVLLAIARLQGPDRSDSELSSAVIWKLSPLDAAAVETLVQNMFGAVPNRTRLAQWLWNAARGYPSQLHSLLHSLVERKVVHYARGAWLLPAELADEVSAEQSRERTGERTARLDPTARALAATLAAHHGALPETVILQARAELDPQLARAALAQLARERMTLLSDAGHRLLDERVRRALLDTLTREQQVALHAQLAAALRAHDPACIAAVEHERFASLQARELVYAVAVGYHLLYAGDETRGLTLLRNGAIELTLRGEALPLVVADLQAAVTIMRELGRSRFTYSALLTALTLAGTYTDWRLSYRYGDEMMTSLADGSGVTLARDLRPYLGKTLALYCGLATGLLQHWLVPHRRMANTYKVLLLGLMGIGSAVLGVCSVLHDAVRARAIMHQLQPLGWFPRGHPIHMVHEFQLALAEYSRGHYCQAHERCTHVLAYLRSARAGESMPASARLQLEGGVLLAFSQLDALRTDGSAQRTLAAIERLESPTSQQTLAAARVMFHGHRGEHDKFIHALEEMDRLAAEAGSIWRNDVAVPRMLWSTYALCEDVMSLRRAVQQLETLAVQMPSVARLRDFAKACYLCERGLPEDALLQYETVFNTAVEATGLRAIQELGAYARILRKAGKPARAREICELAQAKLSPAERAFQMLTFMPDSELIRALSALGEHERATQLADELVAAHMQHDNALLRGLAHGLRAQLALNSADWPVTDAHLADMGRCFQGTQHAALFAQWLRLQEQARIARAPHIIATAAPTDLQDTVGDTEFFPRADD